uniref:Transmembrane protein 132E n=1 Tax=Glossina morsitans morsitans TaxID=37546 RepID=A0A1B0FGG5_GLOMM
MKITNRMRVGVKCCLQIVLLNFLYFCNCVEVHFESTDSGFFLKHTRQPPVTPEISNIHSSPVPTLRSRTAYDSILSVDRFTVVQTTQPVSIRASYGPFSTKQTVPARYIVPDAIENQTDYMNNTTAALLELQQSNIHLDISAHLVSTKVSPDFPVLRVLFHAGADTSGHLQRQKICVLLHVSYGNHTPLKGRCMPEGEDGVCVAEVVIPFSWFHSVPLPYIKDIPGSIPVKVPQRHVQVSYSVFEPPLRNPEQCEPKVQIQPLTNFAQIPLVAPKVAFKELRPDDSLTILLPQQPLYPMSKFHVPVYIQQSSERSIASFSIKARVKSGIRVLSAMALTDLWNISIEKENTKHTIVRVTALRKEQERIAENQNSSHIKTNDKKVEEVFSWLFEIADDAKELLEGGKIVWSVTYMYDASKAKDIPLENVGLDDSKKRVIAKLEINKDDIQAVLPMAKNWELMNTAVLTGRQVAQAMKVFIVSQGGKVADVTLQSSCHAEDESVIKVSSSCSSVYVDGSEIRGSSNASIIVKYGTYIGLAKFVVWMPEFPLEVYISDFRLSQIKGWKVGEENQYIHKKLRRRKKRSFVIGPYNSGYHNNVGMDKMACRARYQQSPVEIYARFVAIDQNSGRISYFISRRTGLRVTDLVQPLLRVADPKIASLKGRILQGKSMGRTDVQVLSPITGRVIGAKEIRVGSDKVSLVKLIVRVVSGLQLTITADNTIENGYIAETAVTHKLTAQYQEGLLDIDLEFSDGSRTPLRDISVEDYFLLVESLDTEVVAFAPMLASHHPRVIAVGEGNGNLLRVTLLLAENCRTRRNTNATKQSKAISSPLASALASVEVDFNNGNDIVNKHEIVQNDGIVGKDKLKFRNTGDLADIIVGIPLRDSTHHHEPTVQARQHRGVVHSAGKVRYGKATHQGNMTSMEVGMYVLLTAFCFAIVVFIISCVVYASKFKPANVDSGLDRGKIVKGSLNGNDFLQEPRFIKETTTNAHDWVWLGRSTMDRTSIINESSPGQSFINPRDSKIRITSNPIINYSSDVNSNNEATTSFHVNSCEFNANLYNHDAQKTAKIFPNHCQNMENNSNEYRPPIPPHRNIDTRLCGSSYICNQINKPYRSKGDLMLPSGSVTKEILTKNKGQVQQSSPEQIFSPQEICIPVNPSGKIITNNTEKHNAEKLVECPHHKKNVFQFDTLTPKQNNNPDVTNQCANIDKSRDTDKDKLTSLDENVMITKQESNCFVKRDSRQSYPKRCRAKRATIVGNPMFSSTLDGGINQEESLSLDDLDMDYEQIMHYFDNLKESNA